MVITKLLPYIFIIFNLSAIIGIVLHHRFLALLKEYHFEKWKELGSPTLFMNNSIKNNLAVVRFLKNKEYLNINDPHLTKMSQIIWYYSITYLSFFVLITTLFVICLWK
jgi:hypothetical protein